MATATKPKPVARKTTAPKVTPVKEKPSAKKPAVEKAPKEPVKQPDFSVDEIWALGKNFASQIRPELKEFKATVAEKLAAVESDQKTYRDHLTAIKFQERRAERIELSLAELEAGPKERKVRAPGTGRPKKAVEAKVEDDSDDDEDDMDEDKDDEDVEEESDDDDDEDVDLD